MIIRLATPEDAPALAELRYQFRAALDPPRESGGEFLERCSRWMRERLLSRAWRCWVADHEGALVGSVWLHAMEKLPNPVGEGEFYGYISSLFVTREMRGSNLGSRRLLVAHATFHVEILRRNRKGLNCSGHWRAGVPAITD